MSAGAEALDTDVVIVGGGLVGSLLAHALLAAGMRVILIEARDVTVLEQPSFDGRATALANGTVRILDSLGLWQDAVRDAQPIQHIHIGQQGRFGMARIHAEEEGVAALGYTVENRVLGSVLWGSLDGRSGFRCLSPARCSGFTADADGVSVSVAADDTRIDVSARLLIAADGARSSVREALGIQAKADAYDQKAIIANCVTARPHRGWAYERFTPNGPLAVLPLTGERSAIVWTLAEKAAVAIEALGDDEFARAFEREFGLRLGPIEKVGVRASHPLFRLRSEHVIGPRSVLIGNAAVSMHPVAGQSFNLAVRDIATLAELIADAAAGESGASEAGPGHPGAGHTVSGQADPGAQALLERYRQWRIGDQRQVASFTHGLVAGMGLSQPGLAALRGAGLVAFDLLPGAKRALARHTMGLAGRVPRLARGLSLRHSRKS